jgi:hypothetical protein
MIKGIDNRPYLDMTSYLDMQTFDQLQPEIFRGFADARLYAKEGTWMKPGMRVEDASYIRNWKPIYQAIEEFLALPDDDPIKQGGIDLYRDFHNFEVRNRFTRYLKMAMGAYDPYIYYYLWEEGSWDDRTAPRKLTPEAKHFPNVVKWVESLISQDIFENIGRVIFFVCEHDGIPFEHRDLDASHGIWDSNTYTPHRNEFIHVRPSLSKPFYIWDAHAMKKVYIDSRAAWWNDQDWHGGDRIMQQSYGLRIDGKFTENFRKRLGVGHLESY